MSQPVNDFVPTITVPLYRTADSAGHRRAGSPGSPAVPLYKGDDFCGRGSFVSGSGGWTADGKVIYNINNDGKGDFVWSLTGSPAIN